MGDLTPFLFMLLGMISTALVELRDSLEQKQTRWRRYGDMVAYLTGAEDRDVENMYSVLIQVALFGEKGISTAKLRECFQCSYYIVKKLLEKISPNLLQVSQKGRAKYYQLNLTALDRMLLERKLARQNAPAEPAP